jgi:hypothetical protein
MTYPVSLSLSGGGIHSALNWQAISLFRDGYQRQIIHTPDINKEDLHFIYYFRIPQIFSDFLLLNIFLQLNQLEIESECKRLSIQEITRSNWFESLTAKSGAVLSRYHPHTATKWHSLSPSPPLPRPPPAQL